jgi:hypothetical protein
VQAGPLHLNAGTATAIYSVYVSLVYLLAMPGGWFCDRAWGPRKTFAVAGAVISTLVVPSTGPRPDAGGGTHRVAYDTSAAWAGPAATPSRMPAPPSIRATPAAPVLLPVPTGMTPRRLLTWNPFWWES